MTRLSSDLGPLGCGSLVLIAVTAVVYLAAIKPLEARRALLDQGWERQAREPLKGQRARASTAAATSIDGFYRFFERPQRTDEWLAKIYGVATAAGLSIRSAEYRLEDSRQRLERYRVTLPVTGTYTQIRAFMEGALAEIPVLSVDQVSFHRKTRNDPRVEAQITVTLHLPKR